MKNKKFIPVILGTARKGRSSEKVARAVHHILKNHGSIETTLVDVKEHIYGRTIPPWEENDKTKPWRDIVSKADGFLIVTPEYNHGYPGELKMLLDQELKAYNNKPVIVCAVSAGSFGGARVVENLLPVFRELGLMALSHSIYVSNVAEFSDDIEKIEERFKENVEKAIQQINEAIKQ